MNIKRVVNIGLIVTTALVAFGVYNYYQYNDYQENIKNMVINDIDLSSIEDGVYTGSEESRYVSAKARITVSNGVIVDVELLNHDHRRGESAEVLVEQVEEKQTLQLDTVSRATASSKVILKSIENALSQGNQE